MNDDDQTTDCSWISLEAATRNVVVLLRLRNAGNSGNGLPAAPIVGAGADGTAGFASVDPDGTGILQRSNTITAQSAQSSEPSPKSYVAGCVHNRQIR